MIDEEDIVIVKLQKSEAETLRQLIKEREAYTFLTTKLKTYWIFTVAAGVLVIWGLYDKLQGVLNNAG